MRCTVLVFALFLGLTLQAAPPALTLANDLIASPAAVGGRAPHLATTPDGAATHAIWIEPLEGERGGERLCTASFDATGKRWSAPREIVSAENFATSWANTPQLAAGPGGLLAAVWFVNNAAPAHGAHHAETSGEISFSSDGGATWSSPQRLADDSPAQEFASVAALPDGRFLAVWLDARAKQHGGGSQQLFAGIFTSAGKAGKPFALIDARVCDCCPTALTTFADGTATLAYRDRSDDEVRDIFVARFENGTWSEGKPLARDDWKIAGCPVNGPAIAAQGGRVAAAWFTAAGGERRILAATSTDAGGRFFMPLRIDDGKPLGRVSAVSLRDGSSYVSWLENYGTDEIAIWLRRLSPTGELSVPVLLATTNRDRDFGHPRLAIAKNEDPTSPAALLLVHTLKSSGTSQLVTRLLTLPTAAQLAAGRPCATCPPAEDTLRGHALKGRIIRLEPERSIAVVKHEEIPGVMRAMRMPFKVDAETFKTLRAETDILARTERREDGWWLFDVRTLARPEP
jgi:hypothetical protein